MFKADFTRYFHRLSIDPSDYSLLYFTWKGKVYFNVVSPRGMRSAPYFSQPTSNALRSIHSSLGYYLFNYIDDMLGAEFQLKVWDSFHLLLNTIRDIGINQGSHISGLTNFPDISSIFTIFPVFIPMF